MNWLRKLLRLRGPSQEILKHFETGGVVPTIPALHQSDTHRITLNNGCGLIPRKDGTATYVCGSCGARTEIGSPGASATQLMDTLMYFKCPVCGA